MDQIRELREKRNELMNAIQRLVQVFELDTSVQVTELNVWHSYDVEDERDVALVGVKIEL